MRISSRLRSALALGLGLAGWSLRGSIHVNEADVPEAVLFAFDDHAVAFTDNLQLAMEPAEKFSGNPVLRAGRDGDPDEYQLRYYGTVIRVNGKYRMWYNAADKQGFAASGADGATTWLGWRFAYAESSDGIHWVKPSLGLVAFRGSRDNNLIAVPEGFRGYDSLVLYEPEAPDPSRRYKMLAQVRRAGTLEVPGGTSENAFIPLYSADGLRWRVADELTEASPHRIVAGFQLVTAVEAAGLYRWQGMYYLSGQAIGPHARRAATIPYGRHVQIWHSADFLHWSEAQTLGYARQGQYRRPTLRFGDKSPGAVYQGEQTHEGASVWNRGNVLIGLTGFWHGDEDWNKVTHPLGFLVSNDGLHFREPEPEFIFAEVGARGRDWDYGGLAQGQGFENVGDKTYIWYGAPMDQSEGDRTGRPNSRGGGVGLLVLVRDRFGSLSTRDPERDGTAVTSELTATQPFRIWVNAEGLGPESWLEVELVDAAERPLPGSGGPVRLGRSGLRVPVALPGGGPSPVPSGPFRIRLRFTGPERNAIRLYALYVGP